MKFQKYIEESLPGGFDGFGFDDFTSNTSKKEPTKLKSISGSIIKIKNQKFKVFRVNGDFSFSVTKENTKGRKYYELVLSNVDGNEYEVWELTGGGMERKGNKPIVSGKAKVI